MPSSLIQPTARGGNVDRLNPAQRMFVEYILADPQFNPTAAAERAGYKHASQAATKLMKQPTIRAAIGKALYERIHECKIEAAQVLRHLAEALYLDPMELFEVVGGGVFKVKSLDEVPPHIRRCITKLKGRTKTYTDREGGETTETFIEIELMSKDACLALAMKHLGLSGNDKQDVNVNVTGDVLMTLLGQVESMDSKVVDGSVIEKSLEGK